MVKKLHKQPISPAKKPTAKTVENKVSGSKEDKKFFELLKKEKSKSKELEFSKHASQRLKDRDIEINNDEFLKLRDAFSKLKSKGGKDSLVVTNKAAYIVDVKNAKVVTAVDKENMGENVFTKIDSTVFID